MKLLVDHLDQVSKNIVIIILHRSNYNKIKKNDNKQIVVV